MILEYAQLMSTSHAILDNTVMTYRPTHKNHPSAIWARASSANYYWLYDMWRYLLEEYSYRYNGNHACGRLAHELSNCPLNTASDTLMPVFLAMPDVYHRPLNSFADSVEAYRDYYRNEKIDLHKWTKRSTPDWLIT